jgi:hypothetical protein
MNTLCTQNAEILVAEADSRYRFQFKELSKKDVLEGNIETFNIQFFLKKESKSLTG